MKLKIRWHDRLGSTNQHLKKEILEGKMIPSGTLIATHNQTNGTGRFDRPWIAPTPHQPLFFHLPQHQRPTDRHSRSHHGYSDCCPRSPSLSPDSCPTQMAQRPACSRKKSAAFSPNTSNIQSPTKKVLSLALVLT